MNAKAKPPAEPPWVEPAAEAEKFVKPGALLDCVVLAAPPTLPVTVVAEAEGLKKPPVVATERAPDTFPARVAPEALALFTETLPDRLPVVEEALVPAMATWAKAEGAQARTARAAAVAKYLVMVFSC